MEPHKIKISVLFQTTSETPIELTKAAIVSVFSYLSLDAEAVGPYDGAIVVVPRSSLKGTAAHPSAAGMNNLFIGVGRLSHGSLEVATQIASQEEAVHISEVRPDQAALEEVIMQFVLQVDRAVNGDGKARLTSVAVEVLIRRLSVLLDDRDSLIGKLAKAYGDLDIANARVSQLESILDALQQEQYRAKHKTSRPVLSAYALVIATFLGPVAASAINALQPDDPVAVAVDAARRVQLECGTHIDIDDHSVNINIETSRAPLPAND